MSHRKEIFCIALILGLATLSMMGCSVIGFAAGSAMDGKTPERTTIPIDQVENLKPGTRIEVLLKDSTQINGQFGGMDLVSDDQYAERYSKALSMKPAGLILPALGDSVTIGYSIKDRPDSVLKLDGKFSGFGINRLFIDKKGFPPKSEIPLPIVQTVTDRNGNSVSGAVLARLMAENQIPVPEVLKVRNQTQTTSVALNDVRQIDKQNSKNKATAGFLTGILVDLVVLILITNINLSPDLSPGISFE